ncbi:hypothetical protein BDE02_01G384100 [Populus trichocarpa]|nr:hypothetical protein BDE02_01G384100 [Populus trichocarpa]
MAGSASQPFKKIQIQRDDTTFDAYVVGKEDAPGIVVLQEWWGVDFEIKNHLSKSPNLALDSRPLFQICIEERSVWTLLKLSI